jgi:hypothetical protein
LADDQKTNEEQIQEVQTQEEQPQDEQPKEERSDIRKVDLDQEQKAPRVQPTTGVEKIAETETDSVIRFKPGQGLEIISPNRKFRLTTRLSGELLYSATFDRYNDKNTQSFQLRRARLIFGGNWFGEHNKFYIHLAFSPMDMQFKEMISVDSEGNRNTRWVPTKSPVFDFIFQFDHLRDLSFQMGQYRIPYSLQRRVPYTKLQFVDRATANFEFNLDRDIGCNIYSLDFLGLDLLRYYAGVFIGEGRDGFQETDFGMLYTARVEVYPLDLFDNRIEADLARHEKPVLSISTGYAYLASAKGNQGILGKPPSDGGTTDTHNLTADISFKFIGISLFGDFYFRQGERNYGEATILDPDTGAIVPAPLEDPRDGIGWTGQLGYLFPKIPFEIVSRYSQVLPIGNQTSLIRKDEIGAGISWYIFGASMMAQADYHHVFLNGVLDSGADFIRVRFHAQF